MSNPFAAVDTSTASLCVFIMRGINNPFDVDFIPSAADASGVVVPIPAEPVEGKMFVCPSSLTPDE